jgi:hypothetical protein
VGIEKLLVRQCLNSLGYQPRITEHKCSILFQSRDRDKKRLLTLFAALFAAAAAAVGFNVFKLFFFLSSLMDVEDKCAEVFVRGIHFQPILVFANKIRSRISLMVAATLYITPDSITALGITTQAK